MFPNLHCCVIIAGWVETIISDNIGNDDNNVIILPAENS